MHLANLSAAVSVAQPPLPALAPAAVTSQAAGIGVITDSWLYVNQMLDTGDFRFMTTVSGAVAPYDARLSGSRPGT